MPKIDFEFLKKFHNELFEYCELEQVTMSDFKEKVTKEVGVGKYYIHMIFYGLIDAKLVRPNCIDKPLKSTILMSIPAEEERKKIRQKMTTEEKSILGVKE